MRILKLVGDVLFAGAMVMALCIGVVRMIQTLELVAARRHAPIVRHTGYPEEERLIKQAQRFTVLLSNEKFDGFERGTGVLIDSTHVLTCAHMVETVDDDIWVYVYPGREVVKGRPLVGNKYKDVAILELDQPVKLDHYAVFQDSATVGEPITIIGNISGSMQYFVAYGGISGSYMQEFLLTDGIIRPGDSGGPWINEKGEVVAMTDFTFNELGIGGGIRASVIKQFIYDWRYPSISFTLGRGNERYGVYVSGAIAAPKGERK